MKFKNKTGAPRIGTIEPTLTKELYDAVRKRLNKTKKELPDKLIKETIKYSNKEIADWIIKNPEGFELNKNKGFLVISKHLPKEFRTDKEDKIFKIENLDIRESVRKNYLKRYNVDIGRRVDMGKLRQLKELLPSLNFHSLFYTYRPMWFNKRNCNFLKSICYTFEAGKPLRAKLYNSIISGKDYYEFGFDDFYSYKIHPIEKQPKKKWFQTKEEDND